MSIYVYVYMFVHVLVDVYRLQNHTLVNWTLHHSPAISVCDITECSGIIAVPDTSTTVTVNSPNYPRNYSSNLHCRYVITSPVGTRLQYEVYVYAFSCTCTHVHVRTGWWCVLVPLTTLEQASTRWDPISLTTSILKDG